MAGEVPHKEMQRKVRHVGLFGTVLHVSFVDDEQFYELAWCCAAELLQTHTEYKFPKFQLTKCFMDFINLF